jgi:uncharacterized membrane protein
MKIHFNKNKIPLLILVIFGTLLFFMAAANHYFFRTVTYDYGTYNFAFWDYSHFHTSKSTLTPGTFLQDHFSFTLMYFIPVFWLFNWLTGTYTLILIQYSMILIAAWFSYKLVMMKSKDPWLGIGTLLYYFVILGRYTTMSCDCNIAVISSCLIPIFLYFFELKKYILASIILMLALFSRENIPIWFIFIFIVLMIEHRKEKKIVLFSTIGILISVIYFILLFKVFIPSIETADKQYALFNYSALGATPSDAISFIVQHPVDAVKMFFINHLKDPAYDGIKYEFYWVYILSGGFILFLRPKYLIWFIPIVAQKELNDNFVRWGISTYYSIEIVTLLPLSVFVVLSEIRSKYFRYGLAIVVCITTIYVTLNKLNPANCRIEWGANPTKERIYDKDFFKAPFDIPKVNKLLALIPPDAKLSASDRILPHVSQRQFIYIFPNVGDADYIVFSMLIDNWMLSHETNEQKRNEYLSNPNWEIIASESPVVLLRKIQKPNDVLRRITLIGKNAVNCDFEKTDESKKLILFSNNEKADSLSKRTSEKAHSGLYSMKLTKENPFGISYNVKDILESHFIQISVWRYSNGSQNQIVASCGDDFYQSSRTITVKDTTGWAKLELNFLVPKNINPEKFIISLWNSGSEPVYFDDLVIKKF